MASAKKTSVSTQSITSSITSVVLLGIILISINFISGFAYFRMDLTEDKIFTLSEGTKNILSNLEDDVLIKFYFSESSADAPFPYKLYGQRIKEMLGEYVSHSDQRINLQVSDPRPDTDDEAGAVRHGLTPVPLGPGENFYLGMVAIVANNEETIPFFSLDRERFLEYDLTRAISQVSATTRPVIGIMSSLPVMGQNIPMQMHQGPRNSQDWLFVQELKSAYEVKKVNTETDQIPEEISLLMVIHPRNFSESAVYAIDQYILNGGRAIIMVDPASNAQQQNDQSNPFMAMMNRSSNLPKLFQAWGVDYDSNRVVGDMALATRVNMGHQGGLQTLPAWLSAQNDSMSQTSVISAKINSMLMVEAGALSKAANSEHEFIPLIQTSENAALLHTQSLMSPPGELVKQMPTSGSTKTLAAIVRGRFSSAFSEPPSIESEDEQDEERIAAESRRAQLVQRHIQTAQQSVSVMIIADTDFLIDDFCARVINFFGNAMLQPLNDNLAFISNATDFFAGSQDLIAVRSRGQALRPFTRVQQIEQQAQRKWQEEERELTRRLEQIQRRINELQASREDGERTILTPEQRQEILRARKEQSDTMERRRQIRKLLREDIENLGLKVTFINLLTMPLIVTLIGAIVYVKQNKRRAMK